MYILKYRNFELILIVILCGMFQNNYAQENSLEIKKEIKDTFDIKDGSFLLPQKLPKWKFSHAFSIYYVVPPKDWTLDIVNVPFLNYSCKYTLPKAFNFQVSLSTLFVSNRLNFGPFWNYSIKNFHFALGYQAVYNLGSLSEFGYNTLLTGWEQQPSLILAYGFKKTAMILRADLFYTTAFNISHGGFAIRSKDRFLNGYAITATFDQRLHKNKVMSIGLKINYVRYHIVAWPALPVNHYRYPVPEFQIGYNF